MCFLMILIDVNLDTLITDYTRNDESLMDYIVSKYYIIL